MWLFGRAMAALRRFRFRYHDAVVTIKTRSRLVALLANALTADVPRCIVTTGLRQQALQRIRRKLFSLLSVTTGSGSPESDAEPRRDAPSVERRPDDEVDALRLMANSDPVQTEHDQLQRRVTEDREADESYATRREFQRVESFDLLRTPGLVGVGSPAASSRSLFRVTGDWYTPRPHFIVLLRKDNGVVDRRLLQLLQAFDAASSLENFETGVPGFVDELIAAAETAASIIRSVCPSASGPDSDQPRRLTAADRRRRAAAPMVLSIHRGLWISSTTAHFHAHVCTDVAGYETVLNRLKAEPYSALPDDIPGRYVNRKQWDRKPPRVMAAAAETQRRAAVDGSGGDRGRWPRTVDEDVLYEPDVGGRCYMANVRGSPRQAGRYFEDDLKSIGNCYGSGTRSTDRNRPCWRRSAETTPTGPGSWRRVRPDHDGQLSFHKRYPRLGFGGDWRRGRCVSSKAAMLMAMDEKARRHRLAVVDRSTGDDNINGCHLCVYLGDDSDPSAAPTGFDEFQQLIDGEWTDSTDVLGYIQMSASVYYQVLPDDASRSRWKYNFANSKEAVMT